jgi:hypothetical protein
MITSADLCNTSYRNFESLLLTGIRVETYGENLGQTGWMTSIELRRFGRMLQITSRSHVLEVGCGSEARLCSWRERPVAT